MRKRQILVSTLLILTVLIISIVGPTTGAIAAKPPTPTPTSPPGPATPIQIYGAWHCGNDACTWASVRTVSEFDSKNHWLINRGDGNPSVNIVVLSFVHPLKLLNQTTDAGTLNGVPRGMTADVVNYFKSRGIRVMLSIGGITYTDAWNQALAQNPMQFGLNAAINQPVVL